MRTLAIVALLVACSGSPAPAPSTPPPANPPPAEHTESPPAAFDAAVLGQKCTDDTKCSAPSTCAAYYGIAGPGGPQFHTCEIKCGKDTKCPDGTKCVTVADGPGSVCRK